MAIRTEFIRRRAGGRITVRPTVYERNEVTLGRATDCDVHLPDLRVGLHHARLIQINAEKVRIEAGADYHVRVNGASVRRRDIAVGEGVEIKIGPYLLLLSSGEAPGDLVVSIELVDPQTTAADATVGRAALWKSAFIPAKRPTAWLLFVAIAGAFLAFPIAAHYALPDAPADSAPASAEADRASAPAAAAAQASWLAGEMSSAHSNLVADCAACHAEPFARVADATCLGCHEKTRHHAEPARLDLAEPGAGGAEAWLVAIRATLGIPEGRCGSCHFEHGGADGVIPTEAAMCVDCHGALETNLPDTELHDVSSFARRHPEFKPTLIVGRDGAAPRLARITLADRPKEDSGLEFSHAQHLKDPEVIRKAATLTGSAKARIGAEIDCADCHVEDAGGALFEPIEMETACADCHSLAFSAEAGGTVRMLPHGEPSEVRRVLEDFYLAQASSLVLDQGGLLDRPLSAEARGRREMSRVEAFANARRSTDEMIARIFSEDGVCTKCHAAPLASGAEGAPAETTPVILSDQFMPKALFSHARHATGNLACADCHRAEESESATDVLLPGITSCRECHAVPAAEHDGLSSCLTCHGFHDARAAPIMRPALVGAAGSGAIWSRPEAMEGRP